MSKIKFYILALIILLLLSGCTSDNQSDVGQIFGFMRAAFSVEELSEIPEREAPESDEIGCLIGNVNSIDVIDGIVVIKLRIADKIYTANCDIQKIEVWGDISKIEFDSRIRVWADIPNEETEFDAYAIEILGDDDDVISVLNIEIEITNIVYQEDNTEDTSSATQIYAKIAGAEKEYQITAATIEAEEACEYLEVGTRAYVCGDIILVDPPYIRVNELVLINE